METLWDAYVQQSVKPEITITPELAVASTHCCSEQLKITGCVSTLNVLGLDEAAEAELDAAFHRSTFRWF